jgi:dTDP-glucose pyrophosphorylase
MKAVLLARGLGSRMKQDSSTSLGASDAVLTPDQVRAAAAGAKGMMPIGGTARPFLDFVLGALADAGCSEVCFVVAPDHIAIRDYYDGPGRPSRLRIRYAVQPAADGTARAVLSAQEFVGADPFLVVNSDNLYPADVLRSLVGLPEPGLPAYQHYLLATESGFPLDRVAAFAAIEVDPDGYLIRIVEKPGQAYYDAVGGNALVSMNAWRFDPQIFDACRDVPLSSRGEYELPEAVGVAMSQGVRFKTFLARGPVLDLSRRNDVTLVSRRLSGMHPRP